MIAEASRDGGLTGHTADGAGNEHEALRLKPRVSPIDLGDRNTESRMSKQFTKVQGQYLAYIATYTLHGRPPAEADIQAYFKVTPPSVHNMILTLDRRGLIERVPGQARSIRVRLSPDALPRLE